MENLTLIRKSKGWNQEQLAELAGTTQATINRIEKGSDGVTLRMLYAIARALEVPIYALFVDDLSEAELNLIRASRGLSASEESGWREAAVQATSPGHQVDQ